jgi:hypothetical protein
MVSYYEMRFAGVDADTSEDFIALLNTSDRIEALRDAQERFATVVKAYNYDVSGFWLLGYTKEHIGVTASFYKATRSGFTFKEI